MSRMLCYMRLYSYQIRRLSSIGSRNLFKNVIDESGPNSIISISKTPNEGFNLSSGLIATHHMVIHPQFALKWNIDIKKLNLKSYIEEMFSLARLVEPAPEMVIFGTGYKTVRLRNSALELFFESHNIPFEPISTVRNHDYLTYLLYS